VGKFEIHFWTVKYLHGVGWYGWIGVRDVVEDREGDDGVIGDGSKFEDEQMVGGRGGRL
jgi:hypothetical protein